MRKTPSISLTSLTVGRDLTIIGCNRSGIKPLKNICKTNAAVSDVFQPFFSPSVFKSFSKCVAKTFNGECVSARYILKPPVGQKHTLDFSFTPLKTGVDIPAISIIILDVTRLQKDNPQASSAEKLIQSIFHTADNGLALIDDRGNFVKVNDGLCRLLGYSQKELVGRPYIQVVAADERKQVLALQQQFFNGKTDTLERQIMCKNGKLLYCYVTNNLLVDNDNKKFLVKTFRDVTESRKYKDLLHQTASLTKTGGFEFDPVSKKFIWTDELYSIYGKNKEFKPTLPKMLKLYNEADAFTIKAAITNAVKTGNKCSFECRPKMTGGVSKWLYVSGIPLVKNGKVVKIIGTVRDVTTEKIVNLELRKLSLVAQKTNSAVIITDNRGNIEWVNESFTRLTGYSPSEVAGVSPGKLLQGKDTDKTSVKKIKEHLERKLPVSEIIKNYKKDGTPFWINMSIVPVFEGRQLVNYVGVGSDITDLLNAQEAEKINSSLQQKQELFLTMAQNFPDGIIGVLDKNFKYVFVGGAEIAKLGLQQDQLVGESVFDNLYTKKNLEVEPFIKRAFNGEKISFEVQLNGNIYAINAVPLVYEQGRVEQVLLVLFNISKQKKAEEEVWKALKRQTELTELKTKFVSIASHEFRTPLSVALSSIDLILKYTDPPDIEKINKHIARVRTAVRTLTDILNDFLSIGKIEDGKVKIIKTEFNIAVFCEQLIEEAKTMEKNAQHLIYEHEAGEVTVNIDRQPLRHIVMNLLTNAIKYSAEGKRIWLTSAVVGHNLLLIIRDEGIGIPEHDQPHLFDTFFRASNTSNIQGTGMGLHIVKRYTTIMGGTIRVNSMENEGTTVTVMLPC